ncbi:LacI family DNA-binding transcriptional regulator [Demequina pelophila]|uniref:LacI family DNA-binding transcriptional regulator n=1 Tax=Demequina pelophila TaxID=1638984 RepID=UPI0007828642|nr:LacI family DNA-binding transcriptional regulator [Demequina pelophila]
MPTIEDVAREAGVSASTVSYALSGKRSIRQDTRQRVLDAVERLGYLPNASARMLAAKRAQIMAVTAPLHPDTDQSAHMVFALEVTKAARAHGYDTLLLVDDDASEGMRRSAATALADGIVVLDVAAHDERADLARALNHPAVFIGIPDRTDGIVCVDLDFAAAAREAVDALVAAGRRRIGLISHPRTAVLRESNFPLRFRDAFAAHTRELGLSPAVAYPDLHAADRALEDLLAVLPDLDGLVLNTTEEVAQSALDGLAARGMTVPGDVAVVAAGVAFPTSRLSITLDTIPLDAAASCGKAVEILAGIVEDGLEAPGVTLIPPTYLSHGSVVPAAPRPA